MTEVSKTRINIDVDDRVLEKIDNLCANLRIRRPIMFEILIAFYFAYVECSIESKVKQAKK